MTEHYPRIRHPGDNGSLLIREGLSFTFYMRRSHSEVAHRVLSALETYLRFIGPGSLGWYADEEGELHPLDERGWEWTRRELLGDRLRSAQLMDASRAEDRYRFEYWGKDLESSLGRNKANAVCSATFWLPTEVLEEQGPERVRALAMELAAPLPLCSGHGGLSFNAEYDVPGVRRVLSQYWFRHPGIDVYDSPCDYSWEVGTRVRAPHWLTFLGPPVLEELGGWEGLRSRLHTPSTTVQAIEEDKVLITLGPWPEAGDTERGDTLPAYRELAKVLEPWRFEEPNRLVLQSMEETRRWERRFLD
ncbi:DUF3396 domain-containing protein [Hyalangium versicolor]|uniref:DUF3396 domain-containing protein n=1 Tax=Hyalangium versicolor TaxID=2861190 RepID=UPI001CC8F5DE|nr:DUF3396 domain-containing protein [Hyalangium versicolor]